MINRGGTKEMEATLNFRSQWEPCHSLFFLGKKSKCIQNFEHWNTQYSASGESLTASDQWNCFGIHTGCSASIMHQSFSNHGPTATGVQQGLCLFVCSKLVNPWQFPPKGCSLVCFALHCHVCQDISNQWNFLQNCLPGYPPPSPRSGGPWLQMNGALVEFLDLLTSRNNLGTSKKWNCWHPQTSKVSWVRQLA